MVGSRQGGFAKRNSGTVLSHRFPSGRSKASASAAVTAIRPIIELRASNANVVSSPFVNSWQPPAKTLAIFSNYTVKIGRQDAWVQFNAGQPAED